MLDVNDVIENLAWLRDQAALTQDDLARIASVSRGTIQTMERGGPVSRRSWVAVIDALNAHDRLRDKGLRADSLMPPESMLKHGRQRRAAEAKAKGDTVKPFGKPIGEFIKPGFGDIASLDDRDIYETPTFNLGVAAGGWVEVCDYGMPANHDTPEGMRIRERGEFRVYVQGDSMEPTFPDGARVEFRLIRSVDELRVGDYAYVQRDDCKATFKCVAECRKDVLVLEAINEEKYPEPLTIEWEKIVRVGIARGVLIDIPRPPANGKGAKK